MFLVAIRIFAYLLKNKNTIYPMDIRTARMEREQKSTLAQFNHSQAFS